MKSRTCNNSLTNIKEKQYTSSNIINDLSKRIKSLQKDIDNIKKSKKITEKNKSVSNKEHTIYEIKRKKIPNFIKICRNNSKFMNYHTNESSLIYKKINAKNYNKIIRDKKNIFLNFNSSFDKRKKRKIIINGINEQKYETNILNRNKVSYLSHNTNKLKHFFSVDKINTKYKDNINKYENEIKDLNQRKKLLKRKKEELKEKLFMTEIKNKTLEKNITKIKNYNKQIIDNIFLLYEEYFLDDNSINNEIDIKSVILNIKYNYEKTVLNNKFIEGINELLNITILNINNSDKNILFNKINRLIHLKNKYDSYIKDKNKYYIYIASLLNQLNIKNLEILKKYIKNMFMKNIQENKKLNEITKALINDSLYDKTDIHMKFINNAKYLRNNNKKYINNKNINMNTFRNKRKNSLKCNRICYNSYLNENNSKINRIELFNDIDINLIKSEEEKS